MGPFPWLLGGLLVERFEEDGHWPSPHEHQPSHQAAHRLVSCGKRIGPARLDIEFQGFGHQSVVDLERAAARKQGALDLAAEGQYTNAGTIDEHLHLSMLNIAGRFPDHEKSGQLCGICRIGHACAPA